MAMAQWLFYADPARILEHVNGKPSGRQLRLFGVGCCRHIWHLFEHEQSRKAVETAELFADKLIPSAEVMPVEEAATALGAMLTGFDDQMLLSAAAAITIALWCQPTGLALETSRLIRQVMPQETAYQAGILRDILAIPPYPPIALDPAWLRWNHGTVPAIARHVYDDLAFHDLPLPWPTPSKTPAAPTRTSSATAAATRPARPRLLGRGLDFGEDVSGGSRRCRRNCGAGMPEVQQALDVLAHPALLLRPVDGVGTGAVPCVPAGVVWCSRATWYGVRPPITSQRATQPGSFGCGLR